MVPKLHRFGPRRMHVSHHFLFVLQLFLELARARVCVWRASYFRSRRIVDVAASPERHQLANLTLTPLYPFHFP